MLFLLLAFLRLENTFPVVFLSMSTVDPITEISTQPLGYFSKCMHHFWKLLNFQIYDTENLSHWSTVQIHYGEGSQNTAATLLESISTCSALTWGSSPEGRKVLSHWTSVRTGKRTNAIHCCSNADTPESTARFCPYRGSAFMSMICGREGLRLFQASHN